MPHVRLTNVTFKRGAEGEGEADRSCGCDLNLRCHRGGKTYWPGTRAWRDTLMSPEHSRAEDPS